MRKLSVKLLLAIVPAIALAVAAIVWLQYAVARRTIRAYVQNDLDQMARRNALSIDDRLDQRRRDLLLLCDAPLIVYYLYTHK